MTLRFKSFKSFDDAHIDILGDLVLLIGRNGSGKTNALEGIELLAALAHGQHLPTIADVSEPGALQVRGGLKGCARLPGDEFTLLFEAAFGGDPVIYSLTINVKGEPRIARELLIVGGRNIIDAATNPQGLLDLQFDNFDKGPNKPTRTAPGDRTVLSRYEMLIDDKPKALKHAGPIVEALRKNLATAALFNPQPATMRAYARIGDSVLRRTGANISAALYALNQGTEQDKKALTRIRNVVSQLPEEPFIDFTFETTKFNDVLFGVIETANGTPIDARLLSDGTLRTLAILVAIETAAPGSRLIVEEFDNSVHPSRANLLIQSLAETARRKKIHLIISTHNPATLDGLPEDRLGSVWLCYRDRESHSSKMLPLLSVKRVEELLELGQLGDLVTRELIDKHLRQGFEADRKEAAKQWLKSLP